MSARINSQFIVRFVLGLLILVAVGAVMWFFKSLAATLGIAVIAYLILDSPTRSIEHMGVPRWQALAVVLLTVNIVFFSAILFLGGNVYQDLQIIGDGIPTLREKAQASVGSVQEFFPSVNVKEVITPERIAQIQQYFISIISTLLSFLSTWIVNVFLIIPLMTIILLTSGKQIKEGFLSLCPNSYFELSVTLIDKVVETLREYIFARFIESVVIAIICIVGFWIFGLPGAIILGILAGILNLIPYFGPLLSFVPPIVMAIVNESPALAIGAASVIVFAQIIDNAVLQPVLISKAVNVHPILVILVTFMGAELFGPVGMIIAIPIYTILKIMIQNLYQFLASVQRRSTLEEKEQLIEEMQLDQLKGTRFSI